MNVLKVIKKKKVRNEIQIANKYFFIDNKDKSGKVKSSSFLFSISSQMSEDWKRL
jgi:hypothetical protein